MNFQVVGNIFPFNFHIYFNVTLNSNGLFSLPFYFLTQYSDKDFRFSPLILLPRNSGMIFPYYIFQDLTTQLAFSANQTLYHNGKMLNFTEFKSI